MIKVMQLIVTIQTDIMSQTTYVIMLYVYVFSVYGPFCHGPLKFDMSSLFTTF